MFHTLGQMLFVSKHTLFFHAKQKLTLLITTLASRKESWVGIGLTAKRVESALLCPGFLCFLFGLRTIIGIMVGILLVLLLFAVNSNDVFLNEILWVGFSAFDLCAFVSFTFANRFMAHH